MVIFNFFGNIFGYLLWFFYEIFHNYGIAIIFFTLVTKILMIPFSVKQQKSMASQMKMAAKQRELQQKYGQDREKMNAELQKLYQKENYNPMGGCATSLLPFPIMIGIYYSVIYPLQNTLHLAKASINNATAVLSKIPGMTATGQYLELDVMRHFSVLKNYFIENDIFTDGEIAKIEEFSQGFHFLGMDMLAIPQKSSFGSMLWIIPVLCLVSYFAVQWISQKMSGQQQQQGCMKIMFIALPLFSAYWAYIMPAAVGLYWVVSSVLQIVQTVVLHKMYSPAKVAAYNEASHLLLMEEEENKVKPLPKEVQDKIAEKLAPKNTEVITEKAYTHTGESKKKKNAGKGGKSSDYMGAKK